MRDTTGDLEDAGEEERGHIHQWDGLDPLLCPACDMEWVEEEISRRIRSQVSQCRICGDELTPEHFHPEYAAHRGEDGY